MKKALQALQIEGWGSRYEGVENYLSHLARKTRSEGSKKRFAEVLFGFTRFSGLNPDELARLETNEVERLIHRYLDERKASGVSLRKTFESQLRSPLRTGGTLDSKDQEFLVGHPLKGSQDPYFGSGTYVNGFTASFDETKVEELRGRFTKINWEAVSPISKDEVRRQALKGIGSSDEEVGRMMAAIKDKGDVEQSAIIRDSIDEILIRRFREKMREIGRLEGDLNGATGDSRPFTSKIVTEEELPEHVGEGWEIVRELSNGKILVRRANHSGV